MISISIKMFGLLNEELLLFVKINLLVLRTEEND